jgi:hypothetical protein
VSLIVLLTRTVVFGHALFSVTTDSDDADDDDDDVFYQDK